MRKLLVVSGALLLMGVAGTAQTLERAAKPFYASLKLGMSAPRDVKITSGAFSGYAEMDRGLALGGAVGINLKQSMRIEAELSSRTSDIGSLRGGRGETMSGEIRTRALLANLYYALPNTGLLQPYVAAGVGVARHDIESQAALTNNTAEAALKGKKHDNTFLYHAGLGLSYSLSPTTTADLGYRYLKSTDIEVSGANYGLASHEMLAALRFEF